MASDHHEDFSMVDEEECEVRGALTFKPPVEVLPRTKLTETIQKKRVDELRRKKEQIEKERKEKEKEEAEKRLREQQMKRQQLQLEQKRKEEDRKRREEEEERKKMEGGLDKIRDALANNTSAPHITVCGVEVNPAKLRLLMSAMMENYSCMSMDLGRKGLCDEDGLSLAGMLEKNKHLEKLECEGNNLGKKTAESLAEALKVNQTLRSLNLESNNLTMGGNDQAGVIKLAAALAENRSLRVLQLSKNCITFQGGEALANAIEKNDSLILVDLSGNDPTLSVEQLRKIDAAVRRNRERQSALRRDERRERFTLYNEEFKCRQHVMQVEARRLEIEAHEERRLNRMRARLEQWQEDIRNRSQKEAEDFQTLTTDAQDRAEGNKGKKGKKGKKK